MTNYQKRKEKNDEYRSKIMRFTFQLSLGDGEVREWFEQQPEKGAYLKDLILRDKAEQLGYGEQKAPKPRKAGDYEIMQEIRMGGRVLLMGFHPKDGTYMTCYEQYNFLGEKTYPEAVASKSYLEIADTFTKRLQAQVEKVKAFRAARNVPYLQMSALEEQGLQHFDAWAANYGETVTAIELSPEGTGYRAKTRFAKFYNLPELMSVFKNVADIQTADMLKLPVPEAHYHNIALKPSEYQKEIVASLAERAEKVRNREVDSSVDNMLLITNDGRKLALDQRLVNPMLPSDPDSKAAKCAENVFEIWRHTADQRSTQMIFCDLSTPKDDGAFSVYDDIRAKLLELGVPENEIAFIHNAKSEVQKKDLFGKVRSGQVRILLGSTQRMGAGTNCQQKLIALHHLDCPWRPSDLQQREGRIIRQGNENPEVDIYSYVTEGTFDAYLYQLVESKQKFISQIMTSKSPVRSAEDVDEQALSYAEIKALASGNPMIKEKMDLDIEVSKLKLLKANHLSQKYALEDAISKGFPKQIAETQARITGYGADIATVKGNTHPNADGFSPLTLAGVTYADKKEAGAALLTMCQTMLSPEATQIGSYRGLTLELSFDTFAREYRLTMIGQLRHTVTLGTDVFGNLQRMDNALEGLPIKEQACREQLSNLQTQLETAKAEVQKPFPREAELNTKTARLEELNTLLNLDHKEPEIVDAEPDEDQRPPERRRPQMER